MGNFKLRFDPKDVRISIDGETIDIGARSDDKVLFNNDLAQKVLPKFIDINKLRRN